MGAPDPAYLLICFYTLCLEPLLLGHVRKPKNIELDIRLLSISSVYTFIIVTQGTLKKKKLLVSPIL